MIHKKPTIYNLTYNWSLLWYQGSDVESEYGKVNKTWILWVPLWAIWGLLISGGIIVWILP